MAVLFCDVRYMFPTVYYSLVSVISVWALYIFIKQYIIKQKIKKIRYRKIICLFLGCALLSVLLHCTTNLPENIFSVYMIGLCLFMFYGIHSEKSNFRIRKEMKRLLDALTLISTFLMVVGLAILAVFPNGVLINGFDFGIHESRFVGVIPNANVNAFYAVMALVSCHILWKMRKAEGTLTKKIKIYYLICAVIDTVSVFLTDSNDTLLFIITYISFVAFYEVFKDFSKEKFQHFTMRFAIVGLCCVLIIAGFVGMRVLTQNGVSLMITFGESKTQISKGITTDENGSVQIADDTDRDTADNESYSFKHQNKNIDSGRFVLWRQALTLIEHHPIMGIGKANIVEYGTKYVGKLKTTILGNYQYIDFHNGLLTILVSFGLVGFNIFMIFAITVAKAILKPIFRFRKQTARDGNVLVLIAAFCTAYCVYSMFEAALLVDDSYRVFIFWLMLGFGLSYTCKYLRHNRVFPETVTNDVIPLKTRIQNRLKNR
ncbi:MAG: O-antigen ligase family protein [Clostridia bacterium]|nr:O-antigen ligase family protein [Clostridia bacterium]